MSLKVIAGAGAYEIERGSEVQFLLGCLRKAICHIASTRLNVEAFRSEAVLKEVAEQTLTFLRTLGQQCGSVSQLAGRRSVNFLDVLNGLYVTNRRIYHELVSKPTREFSPPINIDTSPLEAYSRARLGSDYAVGVTNPSPIPMSVSAPPSFLELALQRVIGNYKRQQEEAERAQLPGEQNALGPEQQPPPVLQYQEFLSMPQVIMPAKPEVVVSLMQLLQSMPAQRGPPASIEKRAVSKHAALIAAQQLRPVQACPPSAGAITRPAAAAAEQVPLVKAVTTEAAAQEEGEAPRPLQGLPVPVPSSVPIWAPVFPSSASVAVRPRAEADQLASVCAVPIVSAAPPSVPDADRDSLQIELCNIEPNYPLVLEAPKHQDSG